MILIIQDASITPTEAQCTESELSNILNMTNITSFIRTPIHVSNPYNNGPGVAGWPSGRRLTPTEMCFVRQKPEHTLSALNICLARTHSTKHYRGEWNEYG
jgi:hypothetical protein